MRAHSRSPKPAIIGTLAVALVASGAYLLTHSTPSNPTDSTSSSLATNTPTLADTTGFTYKDGTYTGTGSYQTPQDMESISVTITIKNNVINDARISQAATSRDSAEYQSIFSSNFKPQVVGKSVNEVRLSRVSGSSLTSAGFNEALDAIKAQAKA